MAATLYISSVKLDAIKSAQAAKDDAIRVVDTNKELVLAVLERELAKEQKARHDQTNHTQTQIASLDRDYRLLSEKMSTMVHKDDLNATELRLMSAFNKLEKRMELAFPIRREAS